MASWVASGACAFDPGGTKVNNIPAGDSGVAGAWSAAVWRAMMR